MKTNRPDFCAAIIPTRIGAFTAQFTPRGLARLQFPSAKKTAARANGQLLPSARRTSPNWRDALRRVRTRAMVTTERDPPRRASWATFHEMGKFCSARELAEQLNDYFDGKRKSFDLPLDLSEGTDFQRAVWRQMAKIPAGETRTYKQLAARIGKPAAVRAVGAACAANPIPILIPCHRIVASNGKLGGFSGGLHWKQRLLALEKAML
jgi:O-6-methylguanine DNA methyltransferase